LSKKIHIRHINDFTETIVTLVTARSDYAKAVDLY